MADLPAEPVYLPELPDLAGRPTVESVEVEPRATVDSGAVLLRLRARDAAAEVRAPFTGIVTSLYVERGASVAPGALLASLTPLEREQAPISERRQRVARLVVLCAPPLVAAGALVLPLPWLLAAVAAWATSTVVERRAAPRPTVPRSAAARIATVLVWVVLCLVAGAAVAWCCGALAWLIRDGTEGALAAGRLGFFEYTLSVAALLGCWRLLAASLRLTGAGTGVRERLVRAPSPLLALVCVLAAMWVSGVIAIGSQQNAIGVLRSAAQALPGEGAAEWADERRLEWALAETRGVVSCLREHKRRGWGRVTGRVVSPEVVRVTVFSKGRRHRPSASSLSTLLVALENQLAPLEPDVVVRSPVGRDRIIAVGQLTARGRPTDAPPGGRPLSGANRRVALACSATTF